MSWTLALAEAYDESKTYTAQIKVLNYFELGCVISDMIKLCILALDHDLHNVGEKKKQSINVSLILVTVLQLFLWRKWSFWVMLGRWSIQILKLCNRIFIG